MHPFDLGWPQLIAILLLAQRGAEELHSKRNTAPLLAQGGKEAGSTYYPVVLVTHLAWIASIFLLVPANAVVLLPLAAIYVALQVVRYWVIATLGRYWTHRIITLPSAPIVTRGPYSLVRHPNYCVTIAETFLLPMVFGAFALALIMGAIWSVVLYYKIVLEDEALLARRQNEDRRNGALPMPQKNIIPLVKLSEPTGRQSEPARNYLDHR